MPNFLRWVGFLSDKQIEKRYVRAGGVFGDAVSYLMLGECDDFEMRFATWARWEKEYSKRGYLLILSLNTVAMVNPSKNLE